MYCTTEKNVGLVARLEGGIELIVGALNTHGADNSAFCLQALRLLSLYLKSSGEWMLLYSAYWQCWVVSVFETSVTATGIAFKTFLLIHLLCSRKCMNLKS